VVSARVVAASAWAVVDKPGVVIATDNVDSRAVVLLDVLAVAVLDGVVAIGALELLLEVVGAGVLLLEDDGRLMGLEDIGAGVVLAGVLLDTAI
jgi:hypothetical protein